MYLILQHPLSTILQLLSGTQHLEGQSTTYALIYMVCVFLVVVVLLQLWVAAYQLLVALDCHRMQGCCSPFLVRRHKRCTGSQQVPSLFVMSGNFANFLHISLCFNCYHKLLPCPALHLPWLCFLRLSLLHVSVAWPSIAVFLSCVGSVNGAQEFLIECLSIGWYNCFVIAAASSGGSHHSCPYIQPVSGFLTGRFPPKVGAFIDAVARGDDTWGCLVGGVIHCLQTTLKLRSCSLLGLSS